MQNIALATFGTRAAASDFMGWYRTWPVIDGKRNEMSEEGRWGKVRWLSASTLVDHWFELLFPGPQIVDRVELYWAQEGGGFLKPLRWRLESWTGTRWEPVSGRVSADEDRVTVMELDSVEVERLRLFMEAGGGPAARPAVLGLSEFECYSPSPRPGRPSAQVVLTPLVESRANPFWLNWTPVPGAVGYRLQYSQDPGFETGVSAVELRTNWHMPASPLERGTWHYRVAALLEDGTAGPWSTEPGRLDLTGEFEFVLPPLSLAVPEHPRFAASRLEERFRAEAEGVKGPLWAKIQEVLAKPVTHVAQIRNMQDSGDPVDGGPPAEPRTFDDGYWTIERWREIVAAGARVMDLLTLGSFAYALSGKPEYRELVKGWMLHASRWNPEGSTGIESVDHAAHDTLVGLAVAYDALWNELSVEDRALVRNAIAARCRALYRYLNPFENDPNNNHPWFQTTALAFGALALWGEVEEAPEWAEFAAQIYVARYLCLGGVDGEWHEGSDYWTYGLGFVFDLCDAYRSVTGVDLYQHPWLQKTARFKLYVAPPEGPGLSFGDTHNHPPGGEDAAQMFCLASRTRDSHAQWYANQAYARSNPQRPGLLLRLYLWWDPTLAERPPVDLPKSTVFEEAGWALIHTTLEHQRSIHFALHSGHFYGVGGGHSHADQNSFMLYAGGEPLIIDSGCYDYYGSPHFNGWYIKTEAHNTILVNGQGQAVQTAGAHGRVTAFRSTDRYDYVRADASNPLVYEGRLTRFERHVLFLRDLECFVLIDEIETPEPARIDWLMHTQAAPEIRREEGCVRTTVKRQKATLEAWTFGPAIDWQVTDGFPEGMQPTKQIPHEYHLRFSTVEPTTRTRFVTVLAPVMEGKQAPQVTWEVLQSLAGGSQAGESGRQVDESGSRQIEVRGRQIEGRNGQHERADHSQIVASDPQDATQSESIYRVTLKSEGQSATVTHRWAQEPEATAE